MSSVRTIIDLTVNIFGFFYKKQKVDTSIVTMGRPVCVNLGCGLAVAPDWINVDASLNCLFSRAPVFFIAVLYRVSGANRYYSKQQYIDILRGNKFVFHDLARTLPFADNSVDFFFSSHFFEHLFKKDALRLWLDIYQALRPGGVMRIAVPDLEYAISLYPLQKQKMLENYFFVDDYSSFLARHKYMYDFDMLKEALIKIGFVDIHRCRFQEGATPGLDILDNRPEETLFIEARKSLS
jgi:predicted SAM-dependent methyltransferase